MFGNRLKVWMENYIVRPRKKEVQKEKFKGYDNRGGVILESSESLAHSDTGISTSSQQVLSTSTVDNREGYSTTTMESERSGTTHRQTAVSLPSPESAYSTGYSTDGTSPGATGPPEYYINIRTGKHYFPSPTPTPTSPQPNTFLQIHSVNQCLTTTLLPEGSLLATGSPRSPRSRSSSGAQPNGQTPSRLSCYFSPHLDAFASEIQSSSRRQDCLSTFTSNQLENLNFSKSSGKKTSGKSQLASLKLFLKSPRRDKEKPKPEPDLTPTFESKKRWSSNGKTKKWFKQPFQKFGHRRTDSCGGKVQQNEVKRELYFEKNFSHFFSQENSASPRQRNRIKTNPWLPTEPMSSQNFHNLRIEFSPSLTRNRSCSNTPLQNRKGDQGESLQHRIKQLSLRHDDSKIQPNNLERAVSRHASGKLVTNSNDHSDEDLTLNEMMGTYNESYVYEKETDILSDSDPTDCEDYETDSEADNGGDELDFIDNGSATESDDNFPTNTGKCTYFDVTNRKNSFFRKSDRHHFKKSFESKKISKKDQDSKIKREKRKRKSFKREDEEKKKSCEGKTRLKLEVEVDKNVRGPNLNRALTQRMMAKNISKSAEGTPTAARRHKTSREIKETYVGTEKETPKEIKPLPILGDLEADNKYKELIKEAENIFERFRSSPLIKKRSGNDPAGESSSIQRKSETPCGSNVPDSSSRKSPRNLGLKLSAETPKKLQRLNFQGNKQSSFKVTSSGHSPLDPLGPALRIFAVFKPALSEERKISTSSSEGSENGKSCQTTEQEKNLNAFPRSPVVPIAFQSVDLGKPLTSYCPQSEPVKRKIYSCSKTYDKLVKQFEKKPTIFEESIDGGGERVFFASNARDSTSGRRLETCLSGNQGTATKEVLRCSPLGPPPSTPVDLFPPENPHSDAFS